MYPIIRLAWQVFKHRNDPKLGVTDMHVSTHYCLPMDIDIWWELNNGRTLTLYDMGRIPLGYRTDLFEALKKNRWGLTVAGSCPRYRRRVRLFDKVTMKTRLAGWDDKFLYMEQSMWKSDGECASHVLIRSAITDRKGIVAPAKVMEAMGYETVSPVMSEWVQAWVESETKRPWPPMQD